MMMSAHEHRAATLTQRLSALAQQVGRTVKVMEVCGTHTMSASRSGLHGLLPANVTLLSGPGCPVCVTAQGDIDQMIALASMPTVRLCTYGDMMRVPGQHGSLEAVRCNGGRVEAVYSSMDAVKLAARHPDEQVVFAAVGFETTAPATAAAILEAHRRQLRNFTVYACHKRVIPAMAALLENSSQARESLSGFLCPGHVSVVIGAQAYRPLVDRYRKPCVIAGFEPRQMADALARVLEQIRDGRAELENTYRVAVTETGNTAAQRLIEEVFEVTAARWRGLGTLPDSGLSIRRQYRSLDAGDVFGLQPRTDYEPRGCRCGEVITGRARPDQCKLFATGCTPVQPVGPCMVSSEGACQAWFKYHRVALGHTSRGVARRPQEALA